jgi:hypothetical protein
MVNSITKKHLSNALQSLPNNFALREIRFHINQAIQKLNNFEERKTKKEQKTQYQTWWDMIKNGINSPVQLPQRTIDIINQMIEEEKKKPPILEMENETLNE